MYEALFRQTQAQFRPERWNGEPDWNEVWQYVFVFKSSSVVHSPSQEHAEKGYEQQSWLFQFFQLLNLIAF